MITKEKTDRLSSLLAEECSLLGKVLELTDEQSKLLAEGKIDAFNKSLDRRRAVMDKIDGLHQESDVLMQSYVSETEQKKGKRDKKIEAQRTEIRETLALVLNKNDENAAQAEETMEQYSQQSNKLSMSRKSIGLYAQGLMYSGGNYDGKS